MLEPKYSSILERKLNPDKIMALQNQVVDVEPDGTFKEPYVSSIIETLQMIAKRHREYIKSITSDKNFLKNFDQFKAATILSDYDIINQNLQYLVDYNSMINNMTKKDYELYLEYLSDPNNMRKAEKAKHVPN